MARMWVNSVVIDAAVILDRFGLEPAMLKVATGADLQWPQAIATGY
jgi:hypothetical protein